MYTITLCSAEPYHNYTDFTSLLLFFWVCPVQHLRNRVHIHKELSSAHTMTLSSAESYHNYTDFTSAQSLGPATSSHNKSITAATLSREVSVSHQYPRHRSLSQRPPRLVTLITLLPHSPSLFAAVMLSNISLCFVALYNHRNSSSLIHFWFSLIQSSWLHQ